MNIFATDKHFSLFFRNISDKEENFKPLMPARRHDPLQDQAGANFILKKKLFCLSLTNQLALIPSWSDICSYD
jgi:hypothetical protein